MCVYSNLGPATSSDLNLFAIAFTFGRQSTTTSFRGSNAGGAPSEVVAGRQLLANLGMDEVPDPRYKRDDRLTRFLQRAFGGSAAAKEVKRARTADQEAFTVLLARAVSHPGKVSPYGTPLASTNDPLFWPTEAPGRTMAELTMDEKNAISHRGRAFSRLPELLGRLPAR